MRPTYDIIIVGAGIVGSACAYECARAGLKVLLIDREAAGMGVTATGMGHVVMLDDSDVQVAFCNYAQSLWMELAEEAQGQLEWEARGTVWVAADDEEMQHVRDKHAYYEKKNIRTQVLDASMLEQAEPNLRKGLCGGLRVLDDAVLYPPTATEYLVKQAVALGAETLFFSEVTEIGSDGSVVLADGEIIDGGLVINAAGYGSPELTEGIDVFKRKGHLVVTDRYPGLINHQVIELGYLKAAHTMTGDSVAFNVQPRSDGKLLIGSSRQSTAEHKEVDNDILGRMLNRAFEYIPALRDVRAIRCWTGFRPATPDKLPLIGPSLVSEKIWLATGHEGLGITTALATGRIITDRILDRRSEIPTDPFLPARCRKGDPVNG